MKQSALPFISTNRVGTQLPAAATRKKPLPTCIVMAVDSSPEILALYSEIFTNEGYETYVTSFSPTNLQEIERRMPNVLIIDYIPGRMNVGWALFYSVKMHRATATIPVIICTAQSHLMKALARFLVTEWVTVVLKPFDIDDLLSAVQQALNSKQIIGLPSD